MSQIFNFNGRINRAGYIKFFIPYLLINAVLGVAVDASENIVVILTILLISLIMATKYVCMSIKRFHDMNKTGVCVWLLLIPLVGLYFELTLLFKKGTIGDNMYGADLLMVK